MVTTVVRFVTAGTIVASLPWVAAHVGGRAAAVCMVLPVVTGYGLWTLGSTRGPDVMAATALGSIKSLPAALVFMLVIHAAVSWGAPVTAALLIGTAAWLVAITTLFGIITVPVGYLAPAAVIAGTVTAMARHARRP